MVKFGTTAHGKSLVGIGLSAENIRRLQDGQPIRFDLAVWGLSGEVVILAGDTEESILADMVNVGLISEDQARRA